MIEISASAPGKLVLLGEYAVLEGAPALAVAIDRRARVRLRRRDDCRVIVHAPQVDHVQAEARIDAEGCLRWACETAPAQRLQLITQLWQALSREGVVTDLYAGFDLDIDTAGFVLETVGGRRKLGLGSSAALTVALASAWVAASGQKAMLDDRASWLEHLLRWHSDWQDGRGSGVDIATSLLGGMQIYRRAGVENSTRLEAIAGLPAGVHCLFVWSGQSVSTAGSLERLAHWRKAQPEAYATHMARLADASTRAIAALDGNAAGFVASVADVALNLQGFAATCGLEIFSSDQLRLAQLAREQGAAFKPCGAGGDIGMVVSDCAERLDSLRRSIMAVGLHPISLDMAADGLQFLAPVAETGRGQEQQAARSGADL